MPVHVVVEPGHDRTSQRHRGNSRGSFKSRNQSDQVTGQDENSQRNQIIGVSFVSVADDFMALLADHRVDALKDMLEIAGILHRQTRTHSSKDQHKQHENHNLHGYIVRDRRLGMGGMEVENAQNRVGHAAKVFV